MVRLTVLGLLLAVSACSGDESGAPDAAPTAVDAAVIDAPVDARVDAAIDAAPLLDCIMGPQPPPPPPGFPPSPVMYFCPVGATQCLRNMQTCHCAGPGGVCGGNPDPA